MLNSKRGFCLQAWLLALSCLVGASDYAPAQGFTRIADLNTPVPGGTGTFATLTQPQVHHGNFVFGGRGPVSCSIA
jgi:hypothetical protein